MQKQIQTALLMGNGTPSFSTNAPYTTNNATQYFANETKAFYQQQAPYANNVVTAWIQGISVPDQIIDTTIDIDSETGDLVWVRPTVYASGSTLSLGDDGYLEQHATSLYTAADMTIDERGYLYASVTDPFYTYHQVKLRVSALINPTNGNPLSDDWQRIMVIGGNIDYIPRGAKVVFNGNTWIVTNPSNIQSVLGTAVVRKASATWNYLDYYGNILSEPFCYGDGNNNLSTANNYQENMILMNAYQHACMQYSPLTSELGNNRRIILGNQCYEVRGLQNFIQEFSSDINSVHIQYFDLSVTQPTENDNMTTRVASDSAFSWEILISGIETIAVGGNYTFTAVSKRNGTTVTSTEENPIHYTWTSSSASVATIDANTGVLTAIAEGTSVITCSLVENPSNASSWEITVSATASGNYVDWNTQIPSEIAQYSSAVLTVTYYENGIATEETVVYTFGGASETSYTATVVGNTVTIECWYDDPNDLVVTATHGTESVSATIALNGW